MEIILYDEDLFIRSDFIHNTTRRERTPVSRTSDSSYGFSGLSIGGVGYELTCLPWKLFDGKFYFSEALKDKYYQIYDNIYIESAVYAVNPDDNSVSELYNFLTIPFTEQNLLSALSSHDGLSYDIFTLLINQLNQIDNIDNYDPSTFFTSYVLSKSGFTEIFYDCSPKITVVKKESEIKFTHQLAYHTNSETRVTKQSNIQLYDVFTIN